MKDNPNYVISDARFIDFFKKYPIKDVAETLRVSEFRVRSRAKRLGLVPLEECASNVIPGGLPQKEV